MLRSGSKKREREKDGWDIMLNNGRRRAARNLGMPGGWSHRDGGRRYGNQYGSNKEEEDVGRAIGETRRDGETTDRRLFVW